MKPCCLLTGDLFAAGFVAVGQVAPHDFSLHIPFNGAVLVQVQPVDRRLVTRRA
jgi:hypothetical protein